MIKVKKVEVDKFKNLIMDMYRGYPNWEYHGLVEKVVIMEEARNELIKSGVLIKAIPTISNGKEVDHWMIGPNALSLVSSWKTEELANKTFELNKKITKLTKVMVGVAIATLISAIIQIFV